jgi:hypothetical protein
MDRTIMFRRTHILPVALVAISTNFVFAIADDEDVQLRDQLRRQTGYRRPRPARLEGQGKAPVDAPDGTAAS